MAWTTKPLVIEADPFCDVTTYNIIFRGSTHAFPPLFCHNRLGTFFHWVLERIGFDFRMNKKRAQPGVSSQRHLLVTAGFWATVWVSLGHDR